MTAALALVPQPTAPPRVILRPAPRREPPFDDEVDGPFVGPHDQALPFAVVRPAPPAWRTPRPGRHPSFAAPDPAMWTRRLLVGMIEASAGRRPLQQLAAFLSPSVHHGIGAEFDRARSGGAPHWLHAASVRTIRATEPADGVAELCAVLDNGHRVRAVAMRLELHRGRWRCIRLQLG